MQTDGFGAARHMGWPLCADVMAGVPVVLVLQHEVGVAGFRQPALDERLEQVAHVACRAGHLLLKLGLEEFGWKQILLALVAVGIAPLGDQAELLGFRDVLGRRSAVVATLNLQSLVEIC